MIDTSQAIKSFCKIVTVTNTSVVVIDLKDTQGNEPLKCNYAEISCLGNSSGVVHLTPSSTTYTYDNPARDPIGQPAGDGGAGVLCTVGQLAPSPQVIRTSGAEFFDTIQVHNISGGDADVAINYGVVYTANPLDILKVPNRGL
tara:strand:- start:538 stop:969 length:432 start_codon:yes stop_codon:yes gene_type:complete